VVDEVDVADQESEAAHGYRRVEVPGQHSRDLEAWPRPWNRVKGLRADWPFETADGSSGAAPAAEKAGARAGSSVPAGPNAGTPDNEDNATLAGERSDLFDAYERLRECTWNLSRDVPIQEPLFAYYLEHGSDLRTDAGGLSPAREAGAEALHRLDAVTTPTFVDLLEILPPVPPSAPTLYDGGRTTAAAEEFTLQALPDVPILLLWRTDAPGFTTVHLRVDGEPIEPWTVSAAEEGCWREAWIELPPRPPGNEHLSIRAEFVPAFGSPSPTSFHWWALQPTEP
jgi:hypothetical protein